MATKTYFGFQSPLRSKELTEAIALQHGPGPLFGYAGFSVAGSALTLTPDPTGDNQLEDFNNHFGKLVKDQCRKGIMINAFQGSTGNFGIVTKDGYVEVSNSNEIQITISNTPNQYQEIIVIARHVYSEDINVEMPITYEAYWNQSNISFFTLYKKSIDFNYPVELSDRKIEGLDINATPQSDSQLSYDYLYDSAIAATGLSLETLNNCTLVGVYGIGNDANSGSIQKFIILPYNGKFPMDIGYSWSDINFNKDLLRHLYNIFSGMGELTFEDYLKKLLTESSREKKVVSVAVPIGTIVMWYGSTSTIPYGWEICDGTSSVHNPTIKKPNLMGRFPIGLSTEDSNYSKPGTVGGSNSLTLEVDNIPKHSHIYTADDNSQGKFDSIETGFPMKYDETRDQVVVGTAGSSGSQGVAQAYFTTKTGGNKPIDNRPSYTVVTFIIKTLE